MFSFFPHVEYTGWMNLSYYRGFPDSSVSKESACNAGDPGSIPGWGRSAGEEIGYPLQYSWAFLGAQLVKNLRAMWETWVWSLGWEDPLEKGKATHSSMQKWREVTQSCPTLCDPMNSSLPASSVHGIFQARVLEWVAISPVCREENKIYSYMCFCTLQNALMRLLYVS